MIKYVEELVDDLRLTDMPVDSHVYYARLEATVEELDRLDPRDFLPNAQYMFTLARAALRACSRRRRLRRDFDEVRGTSKSILRCLDHYRGEGSHVSSRDFSFIGDLELRTIIGRDYWELSLILLPAGAWKSTVVMAGSILEAVLLDALTKDEATTAAAKASPCAPGGRPIENWSLHDLIYVAADIGVLPRQREDAIDQILRDYRNYVHPRVEVRTGYPCTEAEAYLAKGALDSVLNHFAST